MSRRETEATLAPSAFSRQAAGVVAAMIAFASIACAFAFDGANPFVFFGIIAVGSLLSLWSLSARAKHRRILEAGWSDYYRGSRWLTPAGETVTALDADLHGATVSAQFEDGYCRRYPLWLLEPVDGFERVSGPEYTSGSNVLLTNVSKTRWRHLDGREGVVRGARRVEAPGEIGHVDYLVLKMDGGVFEFERNYLTPV